MAWWVLLLVATLTLGACERLGDSADQQDSVLIEVPRHPILFSQAQRAWRSSFSAEEAMDLGALRGAREIRGILFRLVSESLLLREADRRGLNISDDQLAQAIGAERGGFHDDLGELPDDLSALAATPAFDDLVIERFGSLDSYRIYTRRRLKVEAVREQLIEEYSDQIEVTEEQIEEAIRLEDLEHSRVEFHARQVVLADRAEAEAIRDQLVRGADFAEIARTHSRAPEAAQGGDLGWFTLEDLIPEITRTVATAEQGRVSQIVESDYGFHLVELLGARERPGMELSERREALRSELIRERASRLLGERISGWWLELGGADMEPALARLRCCREGLLRLRSSIPSED